MIELDKIYNEDCLVTMSRIDDLSINLVLTSPPYNMTKRKGGNSDSGRYDVYKDCLSEEEYLSFTKTLFDSFYRIIKNDGAVIYNFSYSIENPSLPYKVVSEIVKHTHWNLVDTICWKKDCGLPFPANKYRLSRNWEFVWVFAKNPDNFFINRAITSVSSKTNQNYYKLIYNFIEAANNDEETNELNQATFSTELVTKLLDIYSQDGFTIYDPFMGTGTTALSVVKYFHNSHYIGSEISPKQCEYAIRRVEKEMMQPKLF